MDESVNTFLELYEDAEVGEVAYLGCVLRAYWILGLDVSPWVFLELTDAERHLALLAVEGEDFSLYLFAYLEEVLS